MNLWTILWIFPWDVSFGKILLKWSCNQTAFDLTIIGEQNDLENFRSNGINIFCEEHREIPQKSV